VFLLLFIIGPPIETLVFQAFPIFVVRSLNGSALIQIIASALLFSAAHFPEGVATGISAGLIGGLLLRIRVLALAEEVTLAPVLDNDGVPCYPQRHSVRAAPRHRAYRLKNPPKQL